MRMFVDDYRGMEAVWAENRHIQLCVLPELGGKIGSLCYLPRDFEVLFQPSAGVYRRAAYGSDFSAWDTSGADEMFPTIDACPYPHSGLRPGFDHLPDHGELWSVPWEVRAEGGRLYGLAEGVCLPYRFERWIALEGPTVLLEYRLANNGLEPLYGLWAFHGLLACDERTRIELPGVERVVNVHDSAVLGAPGSIHPWPVVRQPDGGEYRLDRIQPRAAAKCEKFYVEGPLREGVAAVTLDQDRLRCRLRFPAGQVPYLGVWITEGGFKGEYNCALEPSTAFYDSVGIAGRNGSLKPLPPGGVREWKLAIELGPVAAEENA